MDRVDWRALERDGYLVVQSYVDAAALAELAADFAAGPPPTDYNFAYKAMSARGLDALRPRIQSSLAEVRTHTRLDVDVILNGLYFDNRVIEATNFWHQDHDGYYFATKDHTNWLNFYIPIIKPDLARSNLRVVPFGRLKAEAPAIHDRVLGMGGLYFEAGDDGALRLRERAPSGQLVHDDRTDFVPEDFAVTPALGPGDLLLVRGDVLHQTQDRDTFRVAASVRAGCSKHGFKPHRAIEGRLRRRPSA